MTEPNNNTDMDVVQLDPLDGQPYLDELQERLVNLLEPCLTIEEVVTKLQRLYPGSDLVSYALKGASRPKTETLKSHRKHHLSPFTSALHNITSYAVAKLSKVVGENVVGNKKQESEVNKFKTEFIRIIIDDICTLATDFVVRQQVNFIVTRSDIRTAMHADKDLLDMFLSDDNSFLMLDHHPILAYVSTADKSSHYNNNSQQQLSTMTYKQKVRCMVDSENSFIRGLKLVIKVFKMPLEEIPEIKREVKIIFCNIEELLELSKLLLTAFEDALESVGQEDEIPYVGSEIFDLAQAEEFHAYFNFAYRRLHCERHRRESEWFQAYSQIISNEAALNIIKTDNYDNPDPSDSSLAVKHLLPNYLLNSIIQFFEYFKNINELYELSKGHDNRDDELALKETISILIKTKKAIENLLQAELKNQVIEPLNQETSDRIKAILEKKLNDELKHERNMPLPFMPPPEIYRFSEPDSRDNIQFQEKREDLDVRNSLSEMRQRSDTGENPIIKCATLIKLVERLTYHKYQPNIVDSFLITYRSFIPDPEELLDLLIERFKIPDPPLYVFKPDFVGSPDDLSEVDRVEYKHYLKRFRQEYSKPVKMRVINVLKSWIKNHYYDFERHPTLLDKLHLFLDQVYDTDKVLRSLIVSIKKSVEQKRISPREEFELMLSNEPPPILWWTAKANELEKFNILTLHPVEFARQLTIVEFDLFRAIKPAELINVTDVGMKTRKEDKYGSSPNLSRMTRHFTLLSYWIRKCIVEAEDFDKRSAVYNRAIEIMGVLRELNNFTGLLSIGSAIQSAPIMRLSHTRKTLTTTTTKVMEDYLELNDNHQKKLHRELGQCNPPCIPYLGSYQTKLIHAKEGNKTFMDEVDTISPTLSNDEFHSSFSNSPATPISPRTPLLRTTNLPSATSTMQNQFFGGFTPTRPSTSTFGNNSVNNNFNFVNNLGNNMPHSNSQGAIMHQQQPLNQQQPPLTPGQPKMINFAKSRISAGLVADIGNYQNQPYCLKVQPDIRQFIESIEHKMVNFVMLLSPNSTGGSNSNGSIGNNVPAMTIFSNNQKRLDDYLFEQSEKIEPKNCTKPPRSSKSKLPDSWRSPGIKVNNLATTK